MTKMTNLPRDLTEEVLSKVPLTSLRKVRSTCKEWKTLSKSKSFAKKHLGQAHKVVMMMDLRIYLMSIDLNNNNNVESCIKREGKLISGSDEIKDISRVFHCDGLLLFIPKHSTRLVVCNPFSGQTRFIESNCNSRNYSYALGYEKSSSRKHKVLRFITYYHRVYPDFVECKIYNLNSDSWRFLDPPRGFIVDFYDCGLSLKGNTYWLATKKDYRSSFLVCFDFTRERFGPPLPLPFQWFDEDTVSLSSVRDEQLAVLFQSWNTLEMEIWVTNKIDPENVTWNTKVFLQVDMIPLTQFGLTAASFFIDEEKKVAVVFYKKEEPLVYRSRNVAYIVGVDGSLREADLGDSNDKTCYPLACSYVPSLTKLT